MLGNKDAMCKDSKVKDGIYRTKKTIYVRTTTKRQTG